ncbi:MAG: hypothetical protein IPK37_12365 [Austwickia sp.]|nr:MAG: hypothetical protein IPK37_12365 [Austwickia sp.]
MPDQPAEGARPPVRRVGRRRVVTRDAGGVVPRLDPTYDDRDARPALPTAPGTPAGPAGDDERDRWLREQRPPHWG